MSFNLHRYYRPQIISLVKCSKVYKVGYFRRDGQFQGGQTEKGRHTGLSSSLFSDVLRTIGQNITLFHCVLNILYE